MKYHCLFLLFFTLSPVHADWVLHNKASSFNYFSVKNDTLEVNTFSNKHGTVSKHGELVFKIDLGSIDTSNSDRNILIQDLFLETPVFQEATLTTNLGENFFERLTPGIAIHQLIDAKLMLHGVNRAVKLDLLLVRLNNDLLIIKTFQPVMMDLSDFQLTEGLKKLRRVPSFENVTNTIPVSFSLIYKKN